ncbi:MAG: hypothetical protein KJ571_05545 [Bacteroidetes bacterium]|nr:hypothetical protein [Bacteroidota bacterium]
MNTYQKIFGTGPRGLLISLIMLAVFIYGEEYFADFQITEYDFFRTIFFYALSVITIVIIIWSVKSLPPADRGNKLVINGAFKYFRHPLYGAFLSFFNFGLAVFLNNWIYIFWAILQHPLWHWNVKEEEKLMHNIFPLEYEEYCRKTGRFFLNFNKKT